MFCRVGRLACYAGVTAGLWGSAAISACAESPATPGAVTARVAVEPRASRDPSLDGFDPLTHLLRAGVYVSKLTRGKRAELTLDPSLQAHLEALLARYHVPYGAVFAVEPASGRVLAYVSHATEDPAAGDLVRDASPPAASVFKVVTTAALLDAGVSPRRRTCYSGGVRSIEASDLRDDPRRDTRCASLADALGQSANSVFAKLAVRHLDRVRLSRYASAFGFGERLPFDGRVARSAAAIPRDRLEFARTAAGFWHTHLSPFHGALIAATIANRGVMPRASMVERVLGPRGQVLRAFREAPFRPVLTAATARTLGQMMRTTVESGTAHGAFYDADGVPFLPGVEVAAKTGSLTKRDPFRAYSWCIGFAPVDRPRIAVAALVVNTPKWRIKGSYVAREALRKYLVEEHSAD